MPVFWVGNEKKKKLEKHFCQFISLLLRSIESAFIIKHYLERIQYWGEGMNILNYAYFLSHFILMSKHIMPIQYVSTQQSNKSSFLALSSITYRNKSCLSKCLKQDFAVQLFAQKSISISLLIFGICQFSLSFLYHMHNVFRHLSPLFAGRMKPLSQEFCECYHHKIKLLLKTVAAITDLHFPFLRNTLYCMRFHTFQLPLVYEVFTFFQRL